MHSQIIKDQNGTPVSVLINYQDWLHIEQRLNMLKDEVDGSDGPDWYTLTETTNSILNELIAYTSREEIKEYKKPIQDSKRLKELDDFFKEIHAINRSTANFKSVDRMEEIISKYGPLLRAVNSIT